MITIAAQARQALVVFSFLAANICVVFMGQGSVRAGTSDFDREVVRLRSLISGPKGATPLSPSAALVPQDFNSLDLLIELCVTASDDHPKLTTQLWARAHQFLKDVSLDKSKSVAGLMKLGKRVGASDGTDTRALFILGMLYSYMGHSDGAAGMLNALDDRFPRSSGVLWFRAMNNFLSGNSEVALDILYDERFADRLDRRGHYLYAEILRDRAPSEALKSIRQAIASPVLGLYGEPTVDQLKKATEQLTNCAAAQSGFCPGTWLYQAPVTRSGVAGEEQEGPQLKTDLTPRFLYEPKVPVDDAKGQ